MSVHEGGEPQIGIIKFYNPRKGYGFVTRSEGNDVFFHLTHFRTMTVPAPGAVVQFSLGQNREGLTAEDMVVVPPDTVECYGGVITALDSEGGEIVTPDNFAISFRRSDFIPHTRADSLKVGDEVEMHFLMQEADESWRAKVVRSPGYQPESSVGARTERHEPDEEEENRRMLGILYKTDLDEEALQAARSLAERNMRATLSALVSRVFDHRLEPVTRRALVELIPSIYFDDDCQVFLETMTARLREALELEEGPGDAAAGEVLCLLLDDAHFPVRWSQYLLPFGLSLLRNLAPLTPCQALLDEPAQAEAMEVWLTRVCRHVEQRRSGHGYVLTTALATCDELWRRESLHEPLRRVLARLLVALDAEGLANQIYHLRDKITPEFLPVLLPLISQHPDLSQALRSPAQSEIFAQWIEMLLRGSGETLSPEVLATVLPLVEEVRSHLVDEAALNRLLRPVTESLTPTEIVRMLTAEDLPERAVWACLRHLDHRGELSSLLGDPELRGLVTAWLRRTSEQPSAALPREQEVNTALRLIDTLRSSEGLRGELSGIGQSLFAGMHERIATARGEQMVRLLDQFDLRALPGLAATLARRLADEELDEHALRRALSALAELGEPVGSAATAFVAWQRQPADPLLLSECVTAAEACLAAADADSRSVGGVVQEVLATRDIGWHDGFVAGVEAGPQGPAARLQGFAILLPERLFIDPTDFAPNRFVRLLHRRGLALGVVAAPVSETASVYGRIAGPLAVDERNAIVGELVDEAGGRCYFEAAQLRSGGEQPLQEGQLLRFTRLPAVADQPYDYVAFNVHAVFGREDLPQLLDAFVGAADDEVAVAAGAKALELCDEATARLWRERWEQVGEARRARVAAALLPPARERLGELADLR